MKIRPEPLKRSSALMALCAVAALEAMVRPLLPVDAISGMAATGALRAAEAAGLLWWVARSPSGLASMGLNRAALGRGLVTGLIWSAGFALAAAIAGAVIHYGYCIDPRSLIRADVPGGLAAGGLFLLVAGLLSPLAEEIYFRGLLYGLLRSWGPSVAMIGSTALFAAAHAGSGLPVVQCIGGLVFAVAMEKSSSLAAPMVIHVTGNLAIYGLTMITG